MDNPFASLLESGAKPDRSQTENDLFEQVFRITLNSSSKPGQIYLGDMLDDESGIITSQNIDEILLQRLTLSEPDQIKERVVSGSSIDLDSHLNPFVYLFQSYIALNKLKSKFSTADYEHCSSLIINISRSVINLFDSGVELLSQRFVKFVIKYVEDENVRGLLNDYFDKYLQLFEAECSSFFANNADPELFYSTSPVDEKFVISLLDDQLELSFFNNIFQTLNNKVIRVHDVYSNDYAANIELIRFLTRSKLMKYLFVYNSFLSTSLSPTESVANRGILWQTRTLIGKLLSPHVLPLRKFKPQQPGSMLLGAVDMPQNEYRYFTDPARLTRQDVEINEKNMHQAQQLVKSTINSFFYEHLIKSNSSDTIRNLWLKWVTACVEENRARANEWNSMANMNPMMAFGQQELKYASDGLFFNLMDMFLTSSLPFCIDSCESNRDRLKKINNSYSSSEFGHKHALIFNKETKLIPSSTHPAMKETEASFNSFITECYFITNDLIRLSYVSVHQKLMKLNNELGRWQSTYQDLIASNTDISGNPQMRVLKSHYELMSTEFLNLKSCLIEDNLVKKLGRFLSNSSSWLNMLAEMSETTNVLVNVPELLLTNVTEFVICLHRFKESFLPEIFDENSEHLSSFINMILSFMGRADRLFNPHQRAQLAEALECLLPKKSVSMHSFENLGKTSLAIRALILHPNANKLAESLLNVFVSIEMTGQSVQFEQKFNYRRPMYELIEYLWMLPTSGLAVQPEKLLFQHRNKLKEMAEFAVENIENIEQALFLKFLNYLINDANYLLLEGLLYLEKIKQSQDKIEQDNADGRRMDRAQRQELEANLKHMIMIAKFHNFMSLKTIQTIRMLTTEIKKIFCHSVLVDRVATMLNDFLLHLVGKKKRKQLKVKNFEEVEFKPKEVVSVICDIYLNLSTEDDFCQAVSKDDRSYSKDLFNSAIEVLQQISRDVNVIDSFTKLSARVEEIAEQQRLDDASYDDAPEEYLDPIMSTLMSDPVILPSSKKVIDRATIARHLLSDQTDPFNRMPLCIQDLVPATELKIEIEKWKEKKRSENKS